MLRLSEKISTAHLLFFNPLLTSCASSTKYNVGVSLASEPLSPDVVHMSVSNELAKLFNKRIYTE